MKRLSIIFFFSINFHFSFSQDLSGTWEGSATGASYFKLVIVQIKDSCFGYSYDEEFGYCQANFAGFFDPASKKLKGKGLSFIKKTFGHSLANYNLKYSQEGNNEFLKGTVSAKTIGAKLMTFGIPFPAQLHKLSNNVDTTKFMSFKINNNYIKEKDSEEIVHQYIDSNFVNKENRTSKLIKTIYTNMDSIKLILYDDGEIDGDIVTVFDNNKVIINKLLLTSTPFSTTLFFNNSDTLHMIELVANNLGSIPPNTAYLQIIAGAERYEIRASSDFSNNAKINIVYNPK